ncbi:6-hydroxymethylpterin diphosphokinase MptE-like protein [Treponema zioleckii]|uniref:6-hydroxymethylpterin diphosphokinase MptE-like protein n=1 Tax=Treponema zioleckii TaxID=331680 RepID=UPI00168A8CED|nr:6-hydroxymethylpterin diphosphokinase MptE-like protein [Treponema zioleckii]
MNDTKLGQPLAQEKPCLVQTSRGFSVSYKGRFLYSKYDPAKSTIQTINSLNLLPGTLIFCVSPVLWYGLKELLKILPEESFIVAIESENELYDFANEKLEELKKDFSLDSKLPLIFLNQEQAKNIAKLIYEGVEFPPLYTFKRAILLEMSGGTFFANDFYKQIQIIAQNIIASFWKNRLTLVKLGRLFSRNLFHNLSNLENSYDLKNIYKKVSKPILIFGAGETTEQFLREVPKEQIEKCFVLAVDAALPILRDFKIHVDGIAAVESQVAITKAYIANDAKDAILFADMTSRMQITKLAGNKLTYFTSSYDNSHFLKRLNEKKLLPPMFPALGSVGLYAVYLALNLRSSPQKNPIFITGLDFSFSLGKTHANGAPAHLQRLASTNRLTPVENYGAAFRPGAKFFIGKNNVPIFTDIGLSGYAEQFLQAFYGQQNLYDLGFQGIPLGIQQCNYEQFLDFVQQIHSEEKFSTKNIFVKQTSKGQILAFLEGEEKALNRMKELLIFGNDVACCGKTVTQELSELLQQREYLYLHFPDGFKCDVENVSFLKRVRSEIDFFLKDIKRSLQELSKN